VCLVAADLDHFKHVNDAHGHVRGDAVLKDTAYLLRKSLRSFELVYRLGGEEFLIVLPGVSADEGRVIAELYEAKRRGRNLVVADGDGEALTAQAA